MKKYSYFLIFLLGFCQQIFGQGSTDKATDTVSFFRSPYPISKSIALAYTRMNQSHLFLLKLGYEYKHWAASLDLQRSGLQKTWDNGLKNKYINAGFSLAARYYMKEMGRRGFLELGAGNLFPALTSIPQGGETTRTSWKQLLMTWGAGWRVGMSPRGAFGEIGYRGTFAFNRILLYNPPPSPTIFGSTYSANGWYIPARTSVHWIYGAVGWSF